MQPKKATNVLRKIFKILAWTVLGIICLFLLVLILIQLPSVQDYGRKKIVAFLEKKIGTPVQLSHLDIDFPKIVVLEGVYFQDQQKDTLLFGKKLKVDISLLKLLSNTVEVNEISLEGINANISRNAAGVFNFDYIIEAFASKPKPTEPVDSTPMVISLDEINLDKINVKYLDKTLGYDVGVSLNHFDTDIKKFDSEKSVYETDDITLEGVTAVIKQFKPVVENFSRPASVNKPDSTVAKSNLHVKIGDIDFSKINIDYQNDIESMYSTLKLGKLHVETKSIDLNKQVIALDEILLKNTTANIYLGKTQASQQAAAAIKQAGDSLTIAIEENGWIVSVKKVNLQNNNFVFNDNSKPILTKGIDYSHLDIKKMALEADNFYYERDSIAGIINNVSFVEKSGVEIIKFKTDFAYASKQAYLKDLYLETPDSKIQRFLAVTYPSIEAVSKNIGLLQIDADLTGSVIAFKDLLYFVPDLAKQPVFAKNGGAKLQADVVLKGSAGNLLIPRFDVKGFGNTRVSLSGRVSGLPNVNKLFANLRINNISTTATDIKTLAPPGALPQSIRVPEKLAINGSLQGGMQQLITSINLVSSFGNAGINATVANPADSIRANYDAQVSLSSFNVGKLIKKEDQAGAVSLNAHIAGKGYTASGMNLSANGNVSSAQIKGYTYQNLVFDAKGAKGIYNLTAAISDPNIDLNLNAKADMNGKAPSITSSIMVDSISLQPLHLTDENIRIHSKINADFPNLDPDNLVGSLEITDLLVNAGGKRFVSDTIVVNARKTDTGNAITLSSPILSAGLNGKYTLSGLSTAAQTIINRYYHTGQAITQQAVPQNVSFYLQLYNSPFLKELAPELTLSDSMVFRGSINTSAGSIVLNGKVPSLTYGANRLGGATVNINTADSGLIYAIDIRNVTGNSFKIPAALLQGSVADNTVNYNLSVRDEKAREKYLIAGNVHEANGNYRLVLLQNGLKLNYDNWNVNPQNAIEFGAAGIKANGFEIGNNGQVLAISSQTQEYNAPLSVRFNNFQIESLTKIAEQDSLLVGGTINGNANVSNLAHSPVFDADIRVSNFNFKSDTLGDIVIKANNKTADSYSADIAINGNGNAIKINGNYYTANKGSFDFDVLLEHINLASVESFTGGSLKNMSGAVEGRMKVSGTTSAPKVLGNVDFKNAVVNVAMLNSLFRLNNERISFENDGIHFNNFTLRDSANNEAVIHGAAYTTDYAKYRFNLDIDADNFRALNSKKRDNPMYYGVMYIDTRIKIRGTMDEPQINADLKINDKTSVTIVLPQNDPQVAAREGIVSFFDQDAPELDSILLAPYDSSFNKSAIRGLDIVSNIEIDKNAEFSMIVDEANGDFVKIRGEGSLSGGIDPSGKMSLTGTYLINQGSYEMSFNMLRRKFTIQEGSSLTWTGEPTSANIDVTAVYVASAPPIDLVEQQLSGASETIKNTYKQKLPFNVLLKMSGELLTPALTFDIILPEKNYTVSADIVDASNTRLEQIRQDPAEINKQVFALLLLNRFVAEDPFSSGGGSTSATTMAKQSVSRLLSEQLNKLAADLVSGVDINFGLETTQDYTTGSQQDRTDLNVGISKRLLNDRLNVSVGSNFELEGPTQSNQRTNNIAGNIQVDYQLTKDGRLMLRGYRVDQYEVAIQGQVVETGVTFILNVDYDQFREILSRRKQKKVIKKQVKEERQEIGLDRDSTNRSQL